MWHRSLFRPQTFRKPLHLPTVFYVYWLMCYLNFLVQSGWHESCILTGQMAKFLQHSCGPAGAATTHDVQRKHEATTASWGTNLQQLSSVSALSFSLLLLFKTHLHIQGWAFHLFSWTHTSTFYASTPLCSWTLPHPAAANEQSHLRSSHWTETMDLVVCKAEYCTSYKSFLNVYLLYMQIVKIT